MSVMGFYDFKLLQVFFELQADILKGVFALEFEDKTLEVDVDKCFTIEEDGELITNPFVSCLTLTGNYSFSMYMFDFLKEVQDFCEDNELDIEKMRFEDKDEIIKIIRALQSREVMVTDEE